MGNPYDLNYLRYVGWTEQDLDKKFFSAGTVKIISDKVTENLKCLREDKRPIIVTDKVIIGVMSDVYQGLRPQLGNAYTMYNIPPEVDRDDMKTLIDQCVEVLVTNIRSEYEMEVNNKKLTIWTSLLGDFNSHGLRQYTTIKLNHKNLNKVRFNMNY